MSAPLVINLQDGSVWERRAVSRAGVALYALAGTCACPEFVMASEPELAELGIAGSADALPMPVGPEPRTEVERLAKQLVELQEELHTARFDAARARRERDVIRERMSEPFGCAHCGVTQRSHGRRYLTGAGMHGWERPSEEQVKDRMLARRAARIPVGSAPVSEAELDSAMQELSAFLRVRLALESAKRGRREARARVAELEALELGDLDGRVSASCDRPNHPTWLRKVDDTRACPWCVMDLQSDSLVARTHQLAHYQRLEREAEASQRMDGSRAAVANLRIAELNKQRDELIARVAELEAAQQPAEGSSYPPALPWAKHMDADDLEGFLADLVDAASGDDDLQTLDAVEDAIGRWRVIGEAQHAHNTAPGPDAEAGEPS
ncbi:hypothetical protein [Streptomyces ambofaciens]